MGGFPQGYEELSWFDTIMLGDVDPSRWPAGFAASLRELVVERGRSLVVIAGPGTQRLQRVSALQDLLPVEMPQSLRPVSGAVRLRVTPEGLASSLFNQPNALAIWRDLPPMDQIYPPIRKKPGATILVESADYTNEYGRLIVMAEHTVGRGACCMSARTRSGNGRRWARKRSAGSRLTRCSGNSARATLRRRARARAWRTCVCARSQPIPRG